MDKNLKKRKTVGGYRLGQTIYLNGQEMTVYSILSSRSMKLKSYDGKFLDISVERLNRHLSKPQPNMKRNEVTQSTIFDIGKIQNFEFNEDDVKTVCRILQANILLKSNDKNLPVIVTYKRPFGQTPHFQVNVELTGFGETQTITFKTFTCKEVLNKFSVVLSAFGITPEHIKKNYSISEPIAEDLLAKMIKNELVSRMFIGFRVITRDLDDGKVRISVANPADTDVFVSIVKTRKLSRDNLLRLIVKIRKHFRMYRKES